MTERQRDPWSKFYWSDWRSDPKLRACGLAARGLWVEMLGLMHEAEPCGHLLINGKPPTDQQLAVMVGASVAEVRRLKVELSDAGVPTIDGDTWISRRLVRDAQRRATNQANGKSGGNPKLRKSDNRTADVRITEPDKPSDKPRATRVPEARSQKPEGGQSSIPVSVAAREADDLEIPAFLRAKALHPKALGLLVECTDASPDWLAFKALTAMLESGATNAEILDACRAAAAQKSAHPLRSWAYVAAIVETNRTRRHADEQTDQAAAERRSGRIAAAVARVQGGAAAILGLGSERDADAVLPAVPG